VSSRIKDFDKLSPAKQKLLLARLRKREEAEARSEGIPRSPKRDLSGTGGGPFPLSFAQQRLWFIDRLDPGAPTYNLSDALLLEGRLDVPALERTLGAIVRRHEALRTVFDVVEGEAVQWVAPLPGGRFPLAITDLSALDAERADAEARRLAEAEAASPFDVPHGPHLRAGLVRLPGTGSRERWLALLSMHHIVSDGWSMGVLVRELGTFYAAFAAGRSVSLPELPIQYPDFADWQRRTLQGETLEEHLRWWRERLAGSPPFLDLPADHPRPAVTRHQGASFQAPLPADLSAALADLARERGATPFMVLLAAFALLLARHAGEDDIVVGSPVANRNRLETEGLIGFFVNTLVLRVDAAERPGRTFLDLLDEVRGTTLGAYAHQDLPFERIVEELRPERDLSRPPLFQVSLVWQNAPAGDLELPELTLGGFHLPARTAFVDLSVEAAERAGGILADWRFDTGLFEEPTVRRLAERFAVLLRGVVADPFRPLLDLPMLPAAERQVLAEWSRTEVPFPREESLPVLLSRQVEAAPEAPAIETAGGERITYGGLWRRILRLAHRLRALGVGPEVCVGICLERSVEQVIAALAVIQAGGAYLPLDPSHPRERLLLMLETTGAPVVIALEPLLPILPEISGLRVLCLDRDRADVEREPAEPFDSGATADTLAYVMYTSGSTGTPKGVAIPHRGIARLARWCRETGIGPADSFLQLAPFAFDASTLEIWGAFLNGARLVIPPAGPASLEEIGGWVDRQGVTVLWLTAGLFHQMADSRPGGALDRLASLRFLMAGGDALSVPHVRRVLERLPRGGADFALVNGYGPTENTTFTTCHVMRGPQPFATSVPLGRPIAGTRAVVIDRGGRPAAAGMAGELWTGGAGLARGYFGRPDLTANVFVPDAWTDKPGERLYRTGDLARFLADGCLEYLGRIDQQVKIRGFRVEPGEIEAVLASHPDVGACSVVVGRDVAGKRLVACVAPRDPAAPPPVSALRGWLAGRLPEPMIPAAFLVLDALPLTANGKVDRRALVRLLPAPGGAGEAGQGEAPRTPVERRLAALWADLLGGTPAGVCSDFFALGGHSLLATQLVSRLRETFGVEVPLRAVFEAPTLEGLASRIEKAAERAGAPLLAPIERAPGEGPFPLSFAQERLWLLDQIEPGSSAYNMPAALRLAGRLRPELLAAVLGEIVCRHATLRTACCLVAGAPAQIVAPEVPFVLPLVDLTGLAVDGGGDRGEEEARRLATEEALRPFDLARGPMLRALLLRLPADHLLLCTMHHIASDGWSMEVLVREVLALYDAFSQGHPSPLPELPVRYVDYAVWQRRVLQGEALDEGLAYWRGQLAGLPVLDLAVLDRLADRPWHAGAGAEAGRESFVLPAGLTGRLKALGQSEGATLFMVLLAAFQALLARSTGQADVAVGTPVAGRDRTELEGLIGFFVNTLVMRTDLGGNPGFRELLARVRETALAAFAHQQIPFEKLVAELSPERSLARTPFFRAMFVLMNGEGSPLEIPDLAVTPFEAGAGAAKFDLTLSLREMGGDLACDVACDIEYRAALFDAGAIRRLRDDFVALLAEVVEEPGRPLFEMSPGTAERAERLQHAPQPVPAWEAPRTAVERRLGELWSELLGAGPVGAHDDFFKLGGHSLLGTRLVSQLREVFGIEIPLRALFEAPTLAGFAARIEAASPASGAAAGPALPSIPRVPRDGAPLPLSFAQERLWFLDELDAGTPTLNMPFSARLSERLEGAVLARALGEVVRRHESLRTTFGSEGGRPYQRIAPFHPVPLPVIDLRGLTPAAGQDEARRLEAEEALLSFDLARGPLLRGCLIQLEDADRLLITLHHVVADGWSLGLLIRELTALYRAFSAGRPSPLPELPIQYADYAAWQRRWLAGEALETQIAYWRGKLGDPAKPLPVLDLPADRPRPAVQSWRGAGLTHLLDPGLTGRLGALARREGATLFMVLLAGFQALLARWSGQDDVVVGTPVAGRVRAETEGLIGCFLNNLALRTDLAGNPSFRALLGRVRATALEAYAHQDVPFEKLLEELRVERDLSRTPLFQVFLNMLNFPAEEGALGGGGEETSPPEVPSKFDLTIYATETAVGLRLDLVYNADLFDRARMAELGAQLELLLTHAADDPEARIGEVTLLTPAARAVLPDPAQPLPRAWLGPVPERVAEHARLHPDAPAAVDRAGTWTYGRLDAHAGRLAARLREAGIGTGDVVAVFAHRGAALAAALLGVWRSGAAFAILDPAYPPARLAAILDLARPGAFLRLAAAGAPPMEVDERVQDIPRFVLPEKAEGWEALGPAVDGPRTETGPDDLAYVAFTSGSTGMPKGILGTHAPLAHFFDWHAHTFGLAEEDRFSVLAGLAHDPLLRDLFAPLWIGATLHVPDPEEMGDPGRLAAWMARERVTVAHLTPAMGQLLAQGAAVGLPDLRRAFFGGDLLIGADLARLAAQAPRAEVVNFYGATETPQAMGWWEAGLKESGLREAGPAPLGRGIDGVQLLVLNPAGNLSGIGELGEIAIRTPYLALGYLGDPAATAERFTSDREGVRVYRTGDLGRYRPDGAVAFAGRADAQVKIRGFRVETGEIEAALLRHPAVGEAAVILGESPDPPLLAFVVLDPAAEPPDLRFWLRGHLPAYMVPAAVLSLDRLPLTPNRKVDRRALAEIAGELIQPAVAEAPRNPVEETLASLWGELLRTDPARIGIHQDFFDLGGHSLLAAQLLARIWDRFQAELPLRALFERPTIAGMAELLAVSRGTESVAPPLIRRDRPRRERGPQDEDHPPLSFAQQRLWFLHQLEPENPAYNLPSAHRLAGPLDAGALARAFAEVVRRHEVLRTRYAAVDGAPVQVIDPPRESRAALPLVDLSGLPEGVREAEAAAWVRRESGAPFNLAVDHPLRARLLRLGPADHALALTLHHIASDGWSNGILVSELAELYRAFAAGRPATLPDLAVQYADFAVWQRRAFEAGALDGQRAYWREHLGDPPPPLELPTDRPRPAIAAHAGSQRGVDLPAALADALSDLGRSRGATLFMTLLAGWAVLLSRYSGQDDLAIGTPVAGRTRVEVEPLIGFFVNTLVIRIDLSGDPPFTDLLDRVREAALGAFGHQDLPFEELVEELRPERDLSHPPLFQVMFVLQNAPAEALNVAGLTFHPLPAESGAATFDLTLSLSTAGGGFGGMLQFKSDLFEAATIDRLLGHFRVLLTAAAARPEERLGDLPLLTAAERGQILGAWNDTATAWPDDLCLHELFERQVDRSPDAIALAVVATGEEISYRELDARAGRLAGWLRARGVGPEVSVGVALERSPELVAALLAVLKAGGAWVPLDPSYPPDRLSLLIEDAAVAVLLTREDLPQGEATAPARLAGGVTPDHLAYRIYTSGSTGRPKAVLVPHRAIVNHMRWLQAEWPLGPSDVMLQTLSVSFDASFFDLWAPLLAGARLVLPSDESLRDAARLAEDVARFGVTRYGNVPPWLAEMVERPAFVSAPALRQVITGGQEFPGVLAERLASSGRQVINFYGPSEAAVTATAWSFTPGSGDRIVPVGRPVSNVRVYVLDVAAEPLPAGVPGELCIGGIGVARGYGGRPDLTADRFRPDPFAEAGARLYHTGDRARRRADGVLEFLGRVDRQVKVRGFRIEPGEIEAVLARHPEVRDVAVVARRAGGGDLRLVAYAVTRQPVAPEDLRAWLAARLPEPMLPASWVFLETLPRTPNGKADLAALPEPERLLPAEGRERVAPRDALEAELAAIWEELLDLRPVGVRDDFFALGGHSLLVLRLLARIEKRLGRTLAPAAIFAAPTIEDLANLLREGETLSGPLVRLHPHGDKPPLVWVHAAAGTVTAYVEVARRLREADPDRPVWALQVASPLPESLEALAARHVSALREAWPAGPYLLAGWSFGGVVAFEMARQLRAAGAEVALLTLVDTRAPGVLEIPRDLPSLLATFAADQGLPPDLDLADREALRPLFETFREHLGLLAAYRPMPYSGRIVLFRAADSLVQAPPDLGWEPLSAGELEIHPLPGDHAGVIRGEGAERLVAEILALLAS
jgi:amino acid adenylation domain-containing protein